MPFIGEIYATLTGLAAMVLMALGIVIAKPVLDRTDVLWATTVRLVGGIFVLLLLGFGKKQRRQMIDCFRPSPIWKVSLPGSFIGAYLSMILWVAGMKYAMVSVAAILNQLSAVFIICFGLFFPGRAVDQTQGYRDSAGI